MAKRILKKTNGEPYKIDGRPTVMTQETIRKLEEAFALGATDAEACFYANIGKSTLYDYQTVNPAFVERKEELKERPILKARQTIVRSLDIPQHAQWFLERKKKDEFSSRQELTAANGEPLILPSVIIEKNDTNTSTGDDSTK